MAKTGHEAGRMAMHLYPAPIAGTRLKEMGVAIFAEDLFLD
jgi:hypothetical protein